jgi:hypothetical protein
LTAKDRTASVWPPAGLRAGQMRFYILSPHKIEAHEHALADFIAEDLMYAIQSAHTKIAVDEEHMRVLEKAYPSYHRYEVIVGKKSNGIT